MFAILRTKTLWWINSSGQLEWECSGELSHCGSGHEDATKHCHQNDIKGEQEWKIPC